MTAALRFLKNRLRPSRNTWVLAVTQYVIWNTVNYVWGKHTDEYYKWYYINMSLFVCLSLWSVAGLLSGESRKYRWILITLAWVAIFKMVYVALIVTGTMEEHTILSIVGTLFVAVVGIIVLKWPRH